MGRHKYVSPASVAADSGDVEAEAEAASVAPAPDSPARERRRRSSAPAYTGMAGALERAPTVGVSAPGEGGDAGCPPGAGEGLGADAEARAVRDAEARMRAREWFIHVGGATNLPSTDWNARSDPYCRVELDGVAVGKTRILKGTCHPCWSQAFPLGVLKPESRLHLSVWDADTVGKDDLLGTVAIRGSDVEKARQDVLNMPLLDAKGDRQATKSGESSLGVAVVEARHLPRCDSRVVRRLR